MAYSRARSVVPGRHSRPPGAEEVRRTCLAVLTILIAQYALGIFLNLFVSVPASASDKHAGLLGEVVSGPFALTLHALLGLSLTGTAIVLLARTVRLEDPLLIALATVALAAIGGAFAAGEIFARDGGQTSASFTMALLAGIAMLSYVGMLAMIGAPQRRRAHARAPQPAAHARAGSGLLAGQDQDFDQDPDLGWSEQGWSEQGWSEQGWQEDAWSEPAWSEPAWPGPGTPGPGRPEPAWSGPAQTGPPQPRPAQTGPGRPEPLPMRRPQQNSERTVVGVTWEAPWSRGPADW